MSLNFCFSKELNFYHWKWKKKFIQRWMNETKSNLESVHSLCKLVCCCCFRSLSARSSRSPSWRRRACDTSAPACVLTGESDWAHPAAILAATLVEFLLSCVPKTLDASLRGHSVQILTPCPTHANDRNLLVVVVGRWARTSVTLDRGLVVVFLLFFFVVGVNLAGF